MNPVVNRHRTPFGIVMAALAFCGIQDSFVPQAASAQTVSGWGYNGEGGLGDGTNDEHWIPVTTGLGSEVIALEGGTDFSLALLADGTVASWGRNTEGQLGDGTTVSRNVPGPVLGLANIVQIAQPGFDHALALAADGTVWAWGDNSSGQLGDGTTDDQLVPVPVIGIDDAVAVACGRFHSLAIRSDGSVWCWGQNGWGQLGDGTFAESWFPTQAVGIDSAIDVEGGLSHSLALLADGSVLSWGSNEWGELGDGSGVPSGVPLVVPGVNGVAVAAGLSYNVVLAADGTLQSWGDNRYGQIGDGTFVQANTPVTVLDETGITPLGGIVSVSAGNHTVALRDDGVVLAWGYNFYGELGNDSQVDSPLPVVTACLSEVTIAVAADYHSMALGNNACTSTSAPEVHSDARNVVSIAPVRTSAGTAKISYSVGVAGRVHLEVIDALGRQVARIEEGWREPGSFDVSWNGASESGSRVASGIYWARLGHDSGSAIAKFAWLR